MKTIALTPSQIQNFIHFLDGEDCPILLSEFYFNNSEKVFKTKKNWQINFNKASIKWLKKELKEYINFLNDEIKEIQLGGNVDSYWINEAKYHKIRIMLAKRTILKLI